MKRTERECKPLMIRIRFCFRHWSSSTSLAWMSCRACVYVYRAESYITSRVKNASNTGERHETHIRVFLIVVLVALVILSSTEKSNKLRDLRHGRCQFQDRVHLVAYHHRVVRKVKSRVRGWCHNEQRVGQVHSTYGVRFVACTEHGIFSRIPFDDQTLGIGKAAK